MTQISTAGGAPRTMGTSRELNAPRRPGTGGTLANLRHYSFGSTAAIVTSMGLIVGLEAAAVPRMSVITSLLIIAFADNISDSLSIHLYQESESLDEKSALRTTFTNFLARLVVTLSFVGLVIFIPWRWAVPVSVVWGVILLATLTFSVARVRKVSPGPQIAKHIAVAALVIVVSRAVALAISLVVTP